MDYRLYMCIEKEKGQKKNLYIFKSSVDCKGGLNNKILEKLKKKEKKKELSC